jgi:hypothetical protein
MAEPFLQIDVQGDKELARALSRAKDAFRVEHLQNALLAGALLVMNDAKRTVARKTGTLARSLHVGGFGVGLGEGGGHGPDTYPYRNIGAHSDPLTVQVGTNVPYAARIEYGFVGKDVMGRRFHQPAQPYLRPAITANRDKAVAEVRRVLLLQLQAAVR